MADTNNRKLDKVIKIDNESYDVYAVEAERAKTATNADSADKVKGTLSIKKAGAAEAFITFDGSDDKELVLEALAATENANKIQVSMAEGTQYATITIKPSDPSGGNIGDIWFKYLV